MVYLVESFREVKKNCVYLARLVEAVRKVTEGVDKLSFTATAATEAVLEVREDVVVVKEVDYRAIDNVFQELTNDTSERDRPIISYKGLIRFLKNGGNVRYLPGGRYFPRVYGFLEENLENTAELFGAQFQ